PDPRKAHGTAANLFDDIVTEPRSARLSQTVTISSNKFAIAVLEQPSPSFAAKRALGRRNIILLETSELNISPVAVTVRLYRSGARGGSTDLIIVTSSHYFL
ncbi:MAG: hypothetical protein K8U57_23230, partial [Planctomycetes bacterium]|nr:hypothetical protein [Planctomycetota bacterium]